MMKIHIYLVTLIDEKKILDENYLLVAVVVMMTMMMMVYDEEKTMISDVSIQQESRC